MQDIHQYIESLHEDGEIPEFFHHIKDITADYMDIKKSADPINTFYYNLMFRLTNLHITWTVCILSIILIVVQTIIICAYYKGSEWETYCVVLIAILITVKMVNSQHIIYLLMILSSLIFYYVIPDDHYGFIFCIRTAFLLLSIPFILCSVVSVSHMLIGTQELIEWIWSKILKPIFNMTENLTMKIISAIHSLEGSSVVLDLIKAVMTGIHVAVAVVSDVIGVISDIVHGIKDVFAGIGTAIKKIEEFGKSIIQKGVDIWHSIVDFGSSVVHKVSDVVSDIGHWFSHLF